jgi:hypothetical protein
VTYAVSTRLYLIDNKVDEQMNFTVGAGVHKVLRCLFVDLRKRIFKRQHTSYRGFPRVKRRREMALKYSTQKKKGHFLPLKTANFLSFERRNARRTSIIYC